MDWIYGYYNQRRTVTKYIYLSIELKYTFWESVTWVLIVLETCKFNFTTFEIQILCFSLHYISIKVLQVEIRYCSSFESQCVFFSSSLKRHFF